MSTNKQIRELQEENNRLRAQLAVVRKQADGAIELLTDAERHLQDMTVARDEVCALALDAIDGTSEHGMRIRELRKVGDK